MKPPPSFHDTGWQRFFEPFPPTAAMRCFKVEMILAGCQATQGIRSRRRRRNRLRAR
jgi:hypothetical protein